MKKIILALFLGLTFTGKTFANSTPPEHEMLVRVQASRDAVPALQATGLYIYAVEDGYIRGAITPSQVKNLDKGGFRYEVLIPDLVKYSEQVAPGEDLGRYHSYQEIMDTFNLIATNNPTICHLDTIAQSPTGKYVIALKITENAQTEVHRPRLEWDGTTHGNENIGTEVCWYFVQQLVGLYGSDPLITQLVNTREIWIIPCINPEGLTNRTRGNSVCGDMNRDYGYAWNNESGISYPWSQPEIRGFREFMQQHPFVTTMTYHSGAVTVMWPWSYTQRATRDSLFHAELCDRYHDFTGYEAFQISRGLYLCRGTSSDFTYGAEGALGLAAEISDGQPPPASEIDTIAHVNWWGSQDLMIHGAFGIRGVITDSITGLPLKRAMVIPNSPNWMTYTDTCGWYFKYLQPGNYSLKVMADGYVTKTISIITVPADSYVVVDVSMQPDPASPITGYKVVTWICRSSSSAGNTMGIDALGRSDGQVLNLTTSGSAVIEMSQPIVDSSGFDFTVYSPTSRTCAVLVSNDSWNGPWHACTTGTGNISCDLSRAGVTSTRYLRLNDQGQNYQLDAIETGSLTALAENLEFTIPSLKLTFNPNPFRQKIEIQWQIAGNNPGDLKIYNASGRLVKDFKLWSAGANPKSSVSWDGKDNFGKRLPRGIYFVNLKTKGSEEVAKVTLLK